MFEESEKRREESDKINKQLLLDMKLQNEKTHKDLDYIKIDNVNIHKKLEKAEIYTRTS